MGRFISSRRRFFQSSHNFKQSFELAFLADRVKVAIGLEQLKVGEAFSQGTTQERQRLLFCIGIALVPADLGIQAGSLIEEERRAIVLEAILSILAGFLAFSQSSQNYTSAHAGTDVIRIVFEEPIEDRNGFARTVEEVRDSTIGFVDKCLRLRPRIQGKTSASSRSP